MLAADLEQQGQSQLMTSAGVGSDGSLRVIKNGIGIDEMGSIDMSGIVWLRTLRRRHKLYLVTPFISETRTGSRRWPCPRRPRHLPAANVARVVRRVRFQTAFALDSQFKLELAGHQLCGRAPIVF